MSLVWSLGVIGFRDEDRILMDIRKEYVIRLRIFSAALLLKSINIWLSNDKKNQYGVNFSGGTVYMLTVLSSVNCEFHWTLRCSRYSAQSSLSKPTVSTCRCRSRHGLPECWLGQFHPRTTAAVGCCCWWPAGNSRWHDKIEARTAKSALPVLYKHRKMNLWRCTRCLILF